MRRALASICLLLFLAPSMPAAARCTSREGKRLWLEGAKAYNLGNYQDAITQWEAAYLTCADPELLFNLAQAHRKLDNLERARELFKSWLRENPGADPAEREEVKEWVAALEERIEQRRLEEERRAAEAPPVEPEPVEAQPPAPEPAAAQEPPPPVPSPLLAVQTTARGERWYSDNWGWIMAGSGATVLIAGGVTMLVSNSLEREAEETVFHDQANRLYRQAGAWRTISVVAFIGGGALLAGAAVRFYRHGSGRASPASVSVAPSGITFTWSY